MYIYIYIYILYIYIYICILYIYIFCIYIRHYIYKYIKELRRQVFLYNEEVSSCTSYTSCAQVAILLLQDLSTLCVADIYSIYIFSLVCSVSVMQ